MRSLNKLSGAKFSGALALGAVALVSASSLVLAAGGATIIDRLAGSMDSSLNTPPVQEIVGLDCSPSCELWAVDGTVDVAGDLVPIWGFSTTDGGAPTLPGPTIIVGAGEPVSITVHNDLPGVAGDLAFDITTVELGDRTTPFPTIGSGGTGTVQFTANEVGTATYGAGAATPNGNRQWAMGLSGAIIVRPGECALGVPVVYQGCTYGDPQSGLIFAPDDGDLDTPLVPIGTLNGGSVLGYDVGTDSFHDEALVALSSIDPAFAADPMGYDMTNYAPTHHLINGLLAPLTEVIDTQPGHNVLLRYANLSLADHSMGLAGMHQRMLGRDAAAMVHGSDDVTIPLNVGQTVDAMVSIPLDSFASYRYVLSDQVRMPGAVSADPAMAFLAVWGLQSNPGIPSGDIFSITPAGCLAFETDCSESSGSEDLLFAGIVNTPTGAALATDGRFSIDQPGANLNSTGLPGVVSTDGVIFDGIVPVAELATLVNGTHILWVQFSNDGLLVGDPLKTWGNPSGIAFTIDRAGPVVHPVMLEPMYTDGTVDVAMSATADSSLTGSGMVVQGLAVLAPCPALADLQAGPITDSIPMLPSNDDPTTLLDIEGSAPVVELRGTIPAADVATYTGGVEGSYQVSVAAVDNRGVWSSNGAAEPELLESQCGTGELIVDFTAPTTAAVTISPNPNDGTLRYPTVETFLDVVRIFATVSDPVAGVKGAEGFIDAIPDGGTDGGADGTGFAFQAVDGLFDELTEDVYADIPLASVASLPVGLHPVWVHGQDNAGNWETMVAPNAELDRVAQILTPDVDFIHDPGLGQLTVNAVARATGAMIVQIEYTITGSPAVLVPAAPADLSINQVIGGIILADVSGPGDNVSVRVQDSAGNWSAAVELATSSVPVISAVRTVLDGLATATMVGGPTAVEYSIGVTPAAAGTGAAVNFIEGVGVGTPNRPYRLTLPTINNGAPDPQSATEFTIGDIIWVRVMDLRGNWGPAISVTAA